MTKEINKSKSWNDKDVIYTPEHIAKKIIKLYKPKGTILEPCRGKGAFYNNFPKDCQKDWCEIQEGRDFYDYDKKVDWIITNPPFSDFKKFLAKSYEIADNIVFFIPVVKPIATMNRIRKIKEYGGIVSIHFIDPKEIGFQMGWVLGAVYYKKGYKGKMLWAEL